MSDAHAEQSDINAAATIDIAKANAEATKAAGAAQGQASAVGGIASGVSSIFGGLGSMGGTKPASTATSGGFGGKNYGMGYSSLFS